MHGGKREGAGRPPGTRNKRTLEAEAEMKAIADELGATIPNAFKGDAVAFLQSVYKDPRYPLRLRIDAATKALRIEWLLRPPKTPAEMLAELD